MRKTKLVITVGPALLEGGPLREVLMHADALRINASHSTPEERTPVLRLIRETSEALGRRIPVFLDLQGPKWRVGRFETPIELVPGALGALFPEGQDAPQGHAWAVPLPHPELFKGARPGQTWLVDDGNLQLEVVEARGELLRVKVLRGGLLKPRKGVAPLGLDVAFDPLTPKDLEDIRWGVEQEVDLFAQSFVRRASDVQALQATIRAYGGTQPVIAKIEHPKALDHLDEILDVSWGVMVARGDLGVELGVEKVPSIQKRIIRQARMALKPVITATQMLESMIENAQPTRAEASDIANAIWDGTDAVMLSAETAAGKYPLETVQEMANICSAAEAAEDVQLDADFTGRSFGRIDQSIAMGALFTAHHLGAKALVALTDSGSTALWMSRHRIHIPIYALTPKVATQRKMALYRNVRPLLMDTSADRDTALEQAAMHLKTRQIVQPGDVYAITCGEPMGAPGGTNMLKICRVEG